MRVEKDRDIGAKREGVEENERKREIVKYLKFFLGKVTNLNGRKFLFPRFSIVLPFTRAFI